MSQLPPPPPPPPGSQPPPPPPPQYGGTPGGFSVGNAFNYGWTKFQQNLAPLLVAAVILVAVWAIIYFVFQVAFGSLAMGSSTVCTWDVNANGVMEYNCTGGGLGLFSIGFFLLYGLNMLVSFLFFYVMASAFTRASLAITRGETVDFKLMMSSDKLGQVLIGGVIMGIATSIGYMLCIIPGLIVMFFGHFFIFFILDKGMGAVDAIKASVSFVNKNLGSLFGLFLAVLAAYIVGALVCGVGLLVAIPVSILAQAFAYRKLNGEEVVA